LTGAKPAFFSFFEDEKREKRKALRANERMQMNVIVDDRERSADVIKHLRQSADIHLEIRRLKVGDYLVEDTVIVERKTLIDFAESIKDGRLFRQAEQLCNHPKKAVMILEGRFRDFAQSKMTRESMQGALINLMLVWGIPVLRSISEEETARLMIYTANQINRVLSGGIKRFGYRPKSKRKRQLYMLQGLPDVGPGKAEKLLAHFGTVSSVIAADLYDLEAVDGIGKKMAERIYQVVRENGLSYGKSENR